MHARRGARRRGSGRGVAWARRTARQEAGSGRVAIDGRGDGAAAPPAFETRAVHAGQAVDATTARAVPLHQTPSYVFATAAAGADLFARRAFGNLYSRITKLTSDVFEQRVAALEGGATAVCASSGMAAKFLATTICAAGDNIVASPNLYGGTFKQFKVTLPRLGVGVAFADGLGTAAADYERHIDGDTKALYVETMGNPRYSVPNLRAIADPAHAHGIPLVVDNTFGMGGYVCTPIAQGADIVVKSVTM